MGKVSFPSRQTPMATCFCKMRRAVTFLAASVLVVSLTNLVYEYHNVLTGTDRTTGRAQAQHAAKRSVAIPKLRSNHFLRPTIQKFPPSLGNRSEIERTTTAIDPSGWPVASAKRFGSDPRSLQHGSSLSSLPPILSVTQSGEVSAKPFLVVLVCSRPENVQLRLAARQTWGQWLQNSEVALRFAIGQQSSWDYIIEREQTLHSDVIKTPYVDSYANLSHKVLQSISWALRHFPSASYVMKADDDTYVNIPYLLRELHSGVMRESLSVMGALCVKSAVVRNPGDKWFVTYLDYPGDVYPNYIFGGGYVMTSAAARVIVTKSSRADVLHLEDVFITGILARIGGIRQVSHPGFSFWTSRLPSPCEMVRNGKVTGVNLTVNDFYKLHAGINLLLRTGNWTSC